MLCDVSIFYAFSNLGVFKEVALIYYYDLYMHIKNRQLVNTP
jgi:hypothetical protein